MPVPIGRVEGNPGSGATVEVRAADGRFLAWAAYSPASSIRARAWSFAEATPVTADLLAERVRHAVQRRAALAPETTAMRLVFGEADGLPGLIVDRYADQLVTQFQSAGVDAWRDVLIDALLAATGCRDVFDRSDGATRVREGLPAISGVLRGAEPAPQIEVQEHGLRFQVDVRRGHKTGFYIDQRDNRRLARELAERHLARIGPRAALPELLLLHGRFLDRDAGRRRGIRALGRLLGRGFASRRRARDAESALRRTACAGTRLMRSPPCAPCGTRGRCSTSSCSIRPSSLRAITMSIARHAPTRTSTSMRCACWHPGVRC